MKVHDTRALGGRQRLKGDEATSTAQLRRKLTALTKVVCSFYLQVYRHQEVGLTQGYPIKDSSLQGVQNLRCPRQGNATLLTRALSGRDRQGE